MYKMIDLYNIIENNWTYQTFCISFMGQANNRKIIVGISSCLLGNQVRHDGGHKNNDYCTDTLSTVFEFMPICPELEAGMGVPRPAIQLIQTDTGIRAIAPKTGQDFTDGLRSVLDSHQNDISQMSGYIFIHKSPSCGVFRSRIYNSDSEIVKQNGRGVYAHDLISRFPLLPVEEADRLNDARLRENFLLRVYAYHAWQQLNGNAIQKKDVIEFYTQYKYIMLAHSRRYYKEIGALLAKVNDIEIEELKNRFINLFMSGLANLASRGTHANTLFHIQGYLKNNLDKAETASLTELIQSYRQSQVPLITPITLIKHHLQKYPDAYLAKQKYFEPYPYHLGLRSNI